MPFDWREYLAIAAFLRDGQVRGQFPFSAEAAVRCAASRAYYGAFCYARNFAKNRLSFDPGGDERDHAGLRDLFRRTNRTLLAIELNQLRQWRNQCDYDDELQDSLQILEGAVIRAERLIARCQ